MVVENTSDCMRNLMTGRKYTIIHRNKIAWDDSPPKSHNFCAPPNDKQFTHYGVDISV